MKRINWLGRVLRGMNRFLMFFLLVSFIITCCMLLFLYTMIHTMNLTLTADDVSSAAKLTLGNVVLLALLFFILDEIRRRMTVDRPVAKITEAAEKIMQGDFSVRIPPLGTWYSEGRFGEVADCLNRMAEELQNVETLRSDFIANVSHELKTPLAVMHSYGTLLQQPNLPEERRAEYAASITDASRRLADLVTNILRLNKLENQQIAPKFEPFDLSDQICTCLLTFEDIWEEKDISIETDIEDGVTVFSDAEMLSLVWNNLFSNAMKFTDEGGCVSVSLHREDGFAVVSVGDTGCGISPQVGARMFDKFYLGDPSRATRGNGLGLALVKRVIDLTDCSISVQSEQGKGSVFTVRVRCADD